MTEGKIVTVPDNVRNYYGVHDVDVALFLDNFAIRPASRVLVVGCREEATANMLAEIGLDVTGVDLRGYEDVQGHCNYMCIKDDFCNMNRSLNFGNFDAAVLLSCIEHFGMNVYGEGFTHRYYDIIAMRKVWEVLKPNGVVYLTVPFGGYYLEHWPHWRIYDMASFKDRLANGFEIEKVLSASAGFDLVLAGKQRELGEFLEQEEVNHYSGIPPSISTFVMMRKVEHSKF